MRVGYAKIGRAFPLRVDKWSAVGGDMDVWRLLKRLSDDHPDVEFVLIGRNSGDDPQECGFGPNVTNPWTEWRSQMPLMAQKHGYDYDPFIKQADEVTGAAFETLDHIIVWAGQHGTSQMPIPPVGKDWHQQVTNPQYSFVNYGAYLVRGINRWRSRVNGEREEIWLCPDPRNYVKCRDLKWPLREPILAQFEQVRQTKHERFGDTRRPRDLGFDAKTEGPRWIAKSRYVYSALELTMLPEPHEIAMNQEPGPLPIGLIINENRKQVTNPRLDVLKKWIMPFWPDCEIWGQWSDASQEELGRKIEPIPIEQMWSTLRRYRCTLTTPASGSGWATGKPWEAFAIGVVCFFHPAYDTQGHIVPTLKKARDDEVGTLAKWLRVETPDQLQKRVTTLAQDDQAWHWLVTAQRRLFEERFAERRIERLVEERLGLR